MQPHRTSPEKEHIMQNLMNTLGYQFKDPALLKRALTHPSMGGEDNQRLEFLGDAVLQYIMSDILYATHPRDREGQLTHLRALLVCEAALSQVARSLHVGEALIMDKGEALTGGRDKPSVLCDAMEAILAAVYLDGGLDAARGIVLRHWPKPEEVHRPMQDSKGALQEHLQKDGGDAPTYAILAQDGPPHDRTFEAAVYRYGVELARGSGRTKKQAEQAAALAALEKLTGK
jgi:ribonuclease-3